MIVPVGMKTPLPGGPTHPHLKAKFLSLTHAALRHPETLNAHARMSGATKDKALFCMRCGTHLV